MHLCDRRAQMRLLQAHQTTAAQRAGAIQQTPLSFQHGRPLCARIESTDVQQHLYVTVETDPIRVQHDATGIQLPGQLAQQQLTDIVFQAAGPALTLTDTQTVIRFALNQIFPLQVIGQRQRTEQYRRPLVALG